MKDTPDVRTEAARPTAAEEALQWFVRRQSGDVDNTPADHPEFRAWLDEHPAHYREFRRCARLWHDLEAVRPLLRAELADASASWDQAAPRSGFRASDLWRAGRVSAVLAAFLLVVMVGNWWFTPAAIERAEYRTARGERRTVILADGSTITMNTDTALVAELSTAHRTIVLREGEALFSVAHVTNRSFEVVVGQTIVRDIGTQFVVRRQDDTMTVTVVEGAVEVEPPAHDGQKKPGSMLKAGEELTYREGGSLPAVRAVSLPAATAWLEGKAVFEDRPLADVIAEVGRYHAAQTRVVDPEVGALRVSGVFSLSDRDGFLEAIQHALPLSVVQVNGNLALLERRHDPVNRR